VCVCVCVCARTRAEIWTQWQTYKWLLNTHRWFRSVWLGGWLAECCDISWCSEWETSPTTNCHLGAAVHRSCLYSHTTGHNRCEYHPHYISDACQMNAPSDSYHGFIIACWQQWGQIKSYHTSSVKCKDFSWRPRFFLWPVYVTWTYYCGGDHKGGLGELQAQAVPWEDFFFFFCYMFHKYFYFLTLFYLF
jgi:hypothetical protein